MKAKRLGMWLRRVPKDLYRWMLNARPVWVMAGTPLLLGWLADQCLFARFEQHPLQVIGVILQVIALLIIIWGLNTLRKAFRSDKQGFGGAIAESLKRLVRIFNPYPRRSAGLGAIEGGTDGMHGKGETLPVDLRDRVEKLEDEMVQIRSQIADLQGKVEESAEKLSEQMVDRVQGVWDRIAKTHLKGLTPELTAAIWLVLGVILATFPSEVASVLRLELC